MQNQSKPPETLSFVCPRCGHDGGGGVANKLVYVPDNTILFVCNECDSVWLEEDDLMSLPQLFISDFLSEKGQADQFDLLENIT
jgi:hypothetical protein